MRTVNKVTSSRRRTLYIDIETYTDVEAQVCANIICCLVTCELCRGDFDAETPQCCGQRHLAYTGHDCLQQFITAVVMNPKYKNALILGHAMGSFDGIILLQALIEMEVTIRSITSRGMKLMSLVVGPYKCVLRDTFLLYPTSLSRFCAAMGIKDDKSFAPILFNSATALDQPVLRNPPGKKYYVVAKARRTEFNAFYDTIAHKRYDFKTQMVNYCKQDTVVLYKAAETFRLMIQSQFKIHCIWSVAVTTASAAMYIFRHSFLIPNSIPIIHEHCATSINSVECYIHVEYLNLRHNYNFVHAANSGCGERKICGYAVDAYDDNLRIILQFMGCDVSDPIGVVWFTSLGHYTTATSL
jgi:hypothetical protein